MLHRAISWDRTCDNVRVNRGRGFAILPAAMRGCVSVGNGWLISRTLPAAFMVVALAGCSGLGAKKEAAPTDPNAYPANYRKQLADFLRQSLTSRPEFRGALISQPILMPIGDSQRYMVCVQFHGNGQVKTKVAIYFADMISQFVDATPEQCGSVAYTPFTELAAALPAG